MTPEQFTKPDSVSLISVTLIPHPSKGLVSNATVNVPHTLCMMCMDICVWLLKFISHGFHSPILQCRNSKFSFYYWSCFTYVEARTKSLNAMVVILSVSVSLSF